MHNKLGKSLFHCLFYNHFINLSSNKVCGSSELIQSHDIVKKSVVLPLASLRLTFNSNTTKQYFSYKILFVKFFFKQTENTYLFVLTDINIFIISLLHIEKRPRLKQVYGKCLNEMKVT